MIKSHSSKSIGTFKYDTKDYKLKERGAITYLDYIGDGRDIRLPEDCINCSYMFSFYDGKLDLTNFSTEKVEVMLGMFTGYEGRLNLSNFNTSKVRLMTHMFSGASIVKLDLSNFDTSNVTSMSGMFNKFRGDLDVSSFDTSNVLYMEKMFYECRGGLLDLSLSHFNTDRVKNMLDIFDRQLLLHKGSNKLVGIEEFELDKYIKKYKILGLELPTFYRKGGVGI